MNACTTSATGVALGLVRASGKRRGQIGDDADFFQVVAPGGRATLGREPVVRRLHSEHAPTAFKSKLSRRFIRWVKLHHLRYGACHPSFPITYALPAKVLLRRIG